MRTRAQTAFQKRNISDRRPQRYQIPPPLFNELLGRETEESSFEAHSVEVVDSKGGEKRRHHRMMALLSCDCTLNSSLLLSLFLLQHLL